MAIKERKQITGTTAQIDAYAGHEGQIVWDKEKKTFVGMSGTAGTNYPLAQQAYVDECLAGKEDKGVCLPLTGGELTGSVSVKGMSLGSTSSSIYTTDPSKELMITTGNADFNKGGGSLTLYGRDHEMKGGWALIARSSDDDLILLRGDPETRSLKWGGQTVDTIVQEYKNGDNGFIKYASGYQIVWGIGEVGAADEQPVTFATPFVDTNYAVTCSCYNVYAFWVTQVKYTNRITGLVAYPANGVVGGRVMYIAFGRWK